MIIKSGNKYLLYTEDGSRVLSKHDSIKEAREQERAIKTSKRRKGK